MFEFKKNEKIKLLNGDFACVKSKIGEGGQGAVYIVDYKGKEYALKWYLSNYLKSLKPNYKKFYSNLSNNVINGAPSNSFLWMKAVAITGKKSKGFGYLMDLRPDNYVEFTKFIKAKEKFSSTKVVLNAAINVINAFQSLHRMGLSYQDLSPGNFFIDKHTGEVLICDNDNVAPNGQNLGVGGTPGYMAPEVILGAEKPSTNTDLFSLAVIIFELLFLSHPLEGANTCKYPCLTPKVEQEIYAINPVFVCSDVNKVNAPVKGLCSNLINLWPTYPNYIHDIFKKAFSEDALKNPSKRLSEREWKEILYKLYDDSIECPRCKDLNFVSMAKDNKLKCYSCGKDYHGFYKVIVNGYSIVIGKDKVITEYHLNHGNYKELVGTFIESKKNPGVFGLRNDSSYIWAVEYPGKNMINYEPGKTVTMIPDTRITVNNKIIIFKKYYEEN